VVKNFVYHSFFSLSAACPKEPFSKEKTEKKKADI
jgi:hypothetical protein